MEMEKRDRFTGYNTIYRKELLSMFFVVKDKNNNNNDNNKYILINNLFDIFNVFSA